ncbi:TetR/AcrR family transcriptional regulator [Virgibacillus halodenitrificans]|uniref:TetR/AcrR family transcriptional regulator n=1 Tax=Virgibacillus halodenitrificans TaxID=1482 RepID=UPI00030BCBBD|nr:TetR/AcrR family transcriptional regulator [Virgibacillus halodenitrificans]
MARSEEQFKKIRDQRYEEISNAALKIFARKGFAGTKISDITSSINLSHGLLYHYFKSKEEIYVALITNVLELFSQAVEEAESNNGTPYGKLRWLTELTFKGDFDVALDRHMLLMEAMQADFLSQDTKKQIIDQYTTALKGIGRIIAEGQQTGLFRDGDEMELAAYYISLSQGITLWNAKGLYPIRVSADMVLDPLMKRG